MDVQAPGCIGKCYISGLQRVKSDVVFDIIRELELDNKYVLRDLIEASAQTAVALSSKCNLQSCHVVFLTDEDLPEFVGAGAKLDSTTFNSSTKVPTVNILFQIQEKPKPWTFKIGGELHEYTGGLSASAQHPNLFGRMESMSVSGWSGVDNRSFDFKFFKPKFNDKFISGYGIDMNLYRDDHRQYASCFQEVASLDVSLLTKLRHSFRYTAAVRDVQLDKLSNSLVVLQGGTTVKSSLKHIYEFDTRDDRGSPSVGSAFRITSEFAGVGGTEKFIKEEVDFQHNVPLPNGFALNFLSKFGILFPLQKKQTSICDRFFLGGPHPLRGFNYRTVGPLSSNKSLGGELFYSGGLHLRVPLPNSLPQSVTAHLFTNWGSNVLLNRGNVNGTVRGLFSSTRVSVGGGLVFSSAIGRIELNLCRPVRKLSTDRFRDWDFSLMVSFI